MAKIHPALWFRFLLLTLLSGMAWAQLPVTDDTYVSSAAPTTNNGNSPSLVVQQSSNGTTLIKLDISQLQAAGVTSNAVSKATLKLYTSAVTGQGTFDLYQVTSTWLEGTVTYNTIPSMTLVRAGTTCPSGTQCVNTASKYVQVDITTLLQAWLTTPASNYGLALKPNSTTISVTFESKESTTTSHAPELDVVLNTSLAQLQGQIGPLQVGPGTYNISISGTAALAAALSNLSPIQCPGGQVAIGVTNTGNSVCTIVSAASLTGTVAIANGGTSANTAAGALTNLGAASTTALTSETSARQAADTLEASTRATADTALQSNITAETTRATAAEMLKANLAGGNLFIGGKQTLAPAVGGYASLNVPNSTTAPTTPGVGDIWLLNLNPHLNFRDMNGVSQMLAFTSDVTAATNAQTTALNNEIARATTAENTLTTSLAGEVTRATGAEMTLSNSLASEVTRAQGAEALKANLAGGNLFTGGKQTLALSTGTYASLNVPNSTTPLTTPMIGDIWLVNVDPHLNFRDMSGATQMLAFFSDITTANGITLASAKNYTDTQVATEATARIAGDAATLSSANAHTDAGDVSTLASANGYTNTAVGNEATARAAADMAEALARGAADTTLQGNITAETARATAAEATKASLSGNNSFTGSNTFSGAKVDLSQSTATLPVQTIMGTPLTGTNVCMPGQMVLQKDGAPGQQLFICNATFDGWVAVNDDSALNSSLQAALAAETTARQTADTTLQNNINIEATARASADTTLQSNITAEAAARMLADAATLASANTYTDNTKTNILTQSQTFSGSETFSGNNGFSGSNTFTGAKVDLSQAGATLPVQTTMATPAVSGQANTCVDGQMLLQIGGMPGQQLFICNAAHDGWVMVNDDTATTAADHAYTDAQVLIEKSRAIGAEGTLSTNLNSEITRAQGAETSLQNNINTETAARIAADSAEATARQTADAAEAFARAAGDAATLASANTYTDSTKTNILTQPQTFSGNETFSGNNGFSGSSTFTGAKVDLSQAGATLPVQTTMATPPVSGQPNACVDGQMLLQIGGMPGQQLFICNAAHDGWVMVNDDTATTAADHAYTDAQVAAEAAARIAGDSATLSSANAHADAGDVSTLSSANSYTNTAVTNEATARAAADAAEAFARTAADTTLQSNISAETNRATAAETLKANLAGGNAFTGGSQVLAPSAAGYASFNVPNSTTPPSTPAIGDIWLVNLDPHLNFRDMSNTTQMLAFFSDITTANGNTLASANAYTDTKVGAETTRATAAESTLTTSLTNEVTRATSAESTLQSSINNETAARAAAGAAEVTARVAGDASTLSSANTFTTNAVAAEATLRALGDTAAIASANAYTNSQVTTINTSLAGKANLAGGNSFTGNQSFTGNTSMTGNETVSGLFTLPAAAPGNSQSSNALQLNGTDGTGTSQSAQLQALLDGSLSFRFGPTAGPISQKLSIAPTGIITFAPGQTFPGTNNGTVTQVDTGAGLTGGPITNTGTISIATGGVTNAMLQNSSIGVIAGTGIGVTGTSSLGGSFTIANTGVLSFNGRNGLVTPQTNDYSFAQLSGTASATSNLVYNNQANLFTGGKQTLPASAATFASLNFPNTGVTPTTPATGDVWLTSGDGHLQFQSAGGLKNLAFTTDIAAGTVTGTSLSSGQLIVGNGSSAITTGNLTGDVTTSGSTLTTLAATIAGAHNFSNAGNSFTGNGTGLTGLTAANISAGTAGINITGNAATASTAATATTAGNVTGVVAVVNGGTGANNAATVRTNLGAAASGANADITSMADVTNITSTGNLAISAAGDGAPFNLTLAGGSPVTGSTNGGNVILNPGTGHGSGANGQVQVNGGLGLPGSTSGLVTVQPQAAAGTPTLTLPNTSGTFAVTAASPLVLNATTGALTCPTCGTGSGTVIQVNTGAGLTGGGFTTVGTISVATAGVTNAMLANSSVTINTANGLTGGAALSLGGTLNLGTNATSANTVSTLVSRDASGNFSAGTITASLNGNANTANSATLATSANTATTATNAGNLLAGTTVAGSTTWTNVAAPAIPAAGHVAVYADSGTRQLCAKDETGTVNCVGSSGASTPSVIGGGTLVGQTGLPTTGQQDYFMGMFQGGFSTTEANAQALMPRAGAVSSLFVKLEAAPGGTGFVYTVDKNGVATAVTCTVAAAATTCSDTTHSVSFSQGDLITVHGNKNGGSTTAQPAHWTAQMQ